MGSDRLRLQSMVMAMKFWMKGIVLFVFLMLLLSLFLNSCTQKEKGNVEDVSAREDLFANNDPLIREQIKSSLPSVKTAISKSELVATCSIIKIDSILHATQKAPFYLIYAQIDSVLKGNNKRIGKRLYFLEKSTPAFEPASSGNMLFVQCNQMNKKQKVKRVYWQWTPGAPHIMYDSCKHYFSMK